MKKLTIKDVLEKEIRDGFFYGDADVELYESIEQDQLFLTVSYDYNDFPAFANQSNPEVDYETIAVTETFELVLDETSFSICSDFETFTTQFYEKNLVAQAIEILSEFGNHLHSLLITEEMPFVNFKYKDFDTCDIAQKIFEYSNGKIVHVEFKKKDGTIRKMFCLKKFKYEKKTDKVNTDPTLLIVKDIYNGIRSFHLDQIINISFKGTFVI